MQAIHCRYINPTNTRIKASAAAGSVVIPYPHQLSGMEVYLEASRTLCNKLGWIEPTYPPMAGGELPDGSYAFVFVTKE